MANYVNGVLEENLARDITHITQQVRLNMKGDLKNNLQEFKKDIVEAAKSYTDNLTKELKLELDTQFETMMMTLNTTRKMLNGDTPTRPVQPTIRNISN